MFCNKCGKEIPNDSRVCKFCGNPVSQTTNMTGNATVNRNNVKVKKQFYQKAWFWILIVFAFIVFVGIIGSSSDNTNIVSSNPTNQEQEKTNNTNTTTQEEEQNSTGEDERYTVGKTFSNRNIKLTYVSLDDNFTGYSQYADVKSDCKVIKAEFEFENVGSTDYFLNYGDFNCYADGYSCDAFYGVDDAGLTGSFAGNISSGKKANGNVYFEVPKNAKEITIEYDVSGWSSEKVEFTVK